MLGSETYFSETGPLSELEVHWFAEGLAIEHRGSSSLNIPAVLGLLTSAVRPGFCVTAKDLDSSCHACSTSTFLTAPSLSLPFDTIVNK